MQSSQSAASLARQSAASLARQSAASLPKPDLGEQLAHLEAGLTEEILGLREDKLTLMEHHN